MKDPTFPPITAQIEEKVESLRAALRGKERVVVAFSAGVDSTFLAAVAVEVLGDRALAVTATSPSFPARELAEAQELACTLGIRHKVIESHELANPDYANNPGSRCYHCKTELYGLMRGLADQEGIEHVLDGANLDDDADHRPGKKAAQEQRVQSPLRDLGFTKEDIRAASRARGLSTADKPAFACLASRFPYGIQITAEALRNVERAENGLRDLGFRTLRVRAHQDIARIELAPEDIARAADPELRERIVAHLRTCGFRYVTLDLQGYRQGSLNEALRNLGSPRAAFPPR